MTLRSFLLVRAHPRSGVGLIVALVALVLVTTTLAAALTAMRQARIAGSTDVADERMWQGLAAGEQLAIAWLGKNGERAVFTPEEAERGLVIVNDRWSNDDSNGDDSGLSVVLYDGLGGIPAHLASSGSPLRLALPSQLAGVAIPPSSPPEPGHAVDLLERIELYGHCRRFPLPPDSVSAVHWRVTTTVSGGLNPLPATPTAAPAPVSLAVSVSFHSDGRININTAPTALVTAALELAGRGGGQAIITARGNRQFCTVQAAAPGQPDDGPVRLVDRSDQWNALITVRCAGRSRSWWTVFAGGPTGLHRLQRHEADR